MLRTSAVLLSLLFATSSFAQEDGLPPEKFRGGEFNFTRNADDEISVTFDGKEIYHNYYVTFDRIVKIDDTDVALLSGGDGSNACGLTTLIVTRPEDKADAKAVRPLLGEAEREVRRAQDALFKLTAPSVGALLVELANIEIGQARQTRALTQIKKHLEDELLKQLLRREAFLRFGFDPMNFFSGT